MNEGIGYVVVALLIIGFTYGLVKQVQHTIAVQNSNKTVNYKRTLLGNYLTCISFAGFLISFILNVSVAMQIIQSGAITSNNTSASCFMFLAILLIAKFGITPKKPRQTGLLN